jgi:hypothetical protein
MRLRRTRRPLRRPVFGSSHSTPEEVDTEQLLRVSCCLILQCFPDGQKMEEIINCIRPTLGSLIQTVNAESFRADSKRDKTPRRRIANEHQNEIKNFITTMEYQYGLMRADRMRPSRFHSAEDAFGQMDDADVGRDISLDFRKGKIVVSSSLLTFRERGTNRRRSPGTLSSPPLSPEQR